MDPHQSYAIGIDLGATKIDVGLADQMGHVHKHMRLETPMSQGPQAVEKLLIETVQRLLQDTKAPIVGVGVGVAGQVEKESGTVLFAPNLQWKNVPLQANLEAALRTPVTVVNDVRALALGEWKYGAGKDLQDVLFVFMGTGIGGACVSGGTLLSGSSNTFGEVGHMSIDWNGPVCTCGRRGCFEAYCGGWGIAAQAKAAIKEPKEHGAGQKILELADHQFDNITAHHVIEAFRQGDPLAQQIIEQVHKGCVVGCANLVNILSPRRFILGGGIIEAMPELVDIISQGVKDTSLKAATQSLEIIKTQIGKEHGVLGAATVAFEKRSIIK